MTEEQEQPGTPVDRLCSEIQLFDLCDLDTCAYKKGRFCTNELLLEKFEAIREEDDRQTLLYDEDDLEDDDESDFDDFDAEDEGDDQE
jgi:hypothetical protein